MDRHQLEEPLQVLKEDFQRAAKSKDRPKLEQMLHPEYSFISPEGEVFTKPQLIDNIVHRETNFLNHNFKRIELQIAVGPRGSMVTEVADVELIGDLIGQDRTGHYINTAVYVKGPNGWQILGNTITDVANARQSSGESPIDASTTSSASR